MTLSNLEKTLLFLVILFLPTQLGKHFWPQFSYIYSLKIDYLSPTVYFWDVLVIGLLVVWLLRRPKVNLLAVNIFLFFLLTQELSLFGAFNIGAGLVRLEQYSLTAFLGIYLASSDFKKLLNKIYLPLLLGILGESVIAMLQFMKASTLGLWILGERSFSLSTPGIAKFDFYGQQFLRPYATFPHPNVLAGFMLISMFILYKWVRVGQLITKLAIFFGSITIFLTMSRTAILVGFAAAAFLAKEKGRVILIMITIILSPILFTRFSSIFNFDNLTLLRREELTNSAWQIFLKSPLYGVGLNNFIPTMANQLVAGPSRFLQPVHNIFLLALSETGLIGLIGLVGLVGYPIFRLYSYCLLLIALLPWLMILFLGMFDHYFLTLPQGYRLLFLVWGLSLSMVK